MRDTFVKTLASLAESDPRITLVTGDLGFGVLTGFAERFPRQFLNVGVAEQNMTGIATGMAMDGRIVFTYSIANFPTFRCLEQIRNDSCYHDANVKVVAIGGGFSYGSLGISHHATEDLAVLRALPNMTVVAPCDLWEVAEATKALVHHPGTAYLRLDKSHAPRTHADGERFRLGTARVVRHGCDITLVTAGGILSEVLAASDRLAAMGISCRILSVHTVKPLDVEALSSAACKTGGLITIEEHTIHGGLGGAVAETLLELGSIPRRFLRIGLRAGFSSVVGSQQYLRKIYGLDADSIVQSVFECLAGVPNDNVAQASL
jgi:transketolase